MQNNKGHNLIIEKTLEFSIDAINYVQLLETQRKYVIAHQLLKSATSIGANVREAQNAETRSDFIHKMKIAAKEADETEYWLVLCGKINGYPPTVDLLNQCHSIISILSKIISTAKKNS